MAFVSMEFILFLAVVFLVYFLCPKRKRWIVLLIGSLVFYYLSSKKLILVMLASTLVTFLTGLGVGAVYERRDAGIRELGDAVTGKEKKARKTAAKKQAKKVMLLGVLIELFTLIFIKYYGFINETVGSVSGHRLPELQLLLPLGISFYTLQAMAYIIDVYREKMKPDRNFFQFALYMCYFPQIVQGPIPRHRQLAEQLYTGHDFDYRRFMFGLQLILWGWMKKLIIADRVATPVSAIFDQYELYHGQMIFLGAALYGLQVYADFSGGMDIARGVSQVLGINLDMNFLQPYFSTSVEDFWRRWHITLGAWMRDYIFYPLSLSKLFNDLSKKARKAFGNSFGKKLPSFLAMFIVYFLVGVWHGSSWKFIAYGIYNGIFIVLGIMLSETYAAMRKKCRIQEHSAGWKTFQMVRTFVVISIGRLFSRAARFKAAMGMMKLMTFRWWDLSCYVDGSLKKLGLDTANWLVLLVSIGVLMAVDIYHERGGHIRESIAGKNIAVRWIIYCGALILVLIFGIYGPGVVGGGFIYEKF